MKRAVRDIVNAVIVLAFMVALAGCGAQAEGSAPEPEPEQALSSDAMEVAASMCSILTEAGVSEGVEIIFDIGAEAEIDPNDMGEMLLTSVQVFCPEFEDDLVVRIQK